MDLRERILALLSSESLVDFLEGVHLFCESIHSRALAQREIDSELMERAAAVVAMEGWAQHGDYIDKLEYFVDQMPQHGELLMRDDAEGTAFKGIVLFITSIAQGQLNTAAFDNPGEASGWELSKRAALHLARYVEQQGNFLGSLYFKDMATWFGDIAEAQAAFLAALAEIQDWSESSANGIFEILPMAALHFQRLLLRALHNVAQQPVVKAEIFDRYLDTLNAQRQQLRDADEPAQAVEQLIDMVLDARAANGFGN
jgi:hypothetical protein